MKAFDTLDEVVTLEVLVSRAAPTHCRSRLLPEVAHCLPTAEIFFFFDLAEVFAFKIGISKIEIPKPKTLIKQDFTTSILRQANFKGAKLLGASIFDADLTGADLSEADLRMDNFSNRSYLQANLNNANLEGTTATGNTSFKGSNITGSNFTDVSLRDDQREYLCKAADGVNPTTGNATRDTLLCN
ncbi:thylakoid lumenal 15 kDa protein 1, chloroplastic-like [Hibiscus syriacus]|uniref:thylakoid lumenal 15 kDa protein 1, chloroplastic-like n=1 Tax=Hibiscus syriacus TaxID=106335 RepID=UPI001923567A|nr:thylakoid lumenal 15 kDa protein 1, chloroplastic-like [Hibiscus syriacus]